QGDHAPEPRGRGRPEGARGFADLRVGLYVMPALYTPSLMDLAREHPALPSGRLGGLPPVSEAARAPTDGAARVVDALEAERARLAQEIHDGPAQALTNAIFQVDYIERVIDQPELARAEL